MKTSEKQLTSLIAQYLQLKHKSLIYRFDLAADTKLTIGQAVRNKTLHPKRGHPDLIIFEMRGSYGGLFIELKKDSSEVFKQNGEYKKNKHLEEQLAYHEILKNKGYLVIFGLGYKYTVKKIEDYLNGL